MAWVDDYAPDWQAWLDHRLDEPGDHRWHLLLDGVFYPGLWQRLSQARKPGTPAVALFRFLAGCSDEALQASPLVVEFQAGDTVLRRMLGACSGRPMVTLIKTSETATQLADRLSRWCVVDAAGTYFNFRFTDTRRLPTVARVLRAEQRADLLGPATEWHCVNRQGCWERLPLSPENPAESTQTAPSLNEAQFAELVSDSEADEILALLQPDFDVETMQTQPSWRHAMAAQALSHADEQGKTTPADRMQAVQSRLKAAHAKSDLSRSSGRPNREGITR